MLKMTCGLSLRRRLYGVTACCAQIIVAVLGGPVTATDHVGSVNVEPYGHVAAGDVVLVTLCRHPLRLSLTNWGATVLSVLVPDAKGNLEDVVLGLDTLEGYLNGSSPYFGAVVGRVANRIANGTFVLEGVRYNLTRNEGNNTLHGGKIGFDKVLWKLVQTKVDDGYGSPSATLVYSSYDGEQGFPGALNATVTYELISNTELVVRMSAHVGTKATPVNLAQHTYWNLRGHKSGSILNNTIQIFGDKVTEVDADLIPTGRILPVIGTPYDFFSQPAVIGSRFDQLPHGYDINYVLKPSCIFSYRGQLLWAAAKLQEPVSGRSLELFTNQPGLQFYTGNYIPELLRGKDGALYGPHAGLCLETQGFPDAVNHPSFPSVVVQPHANYHHTMLFRFGSQGH